MAAAARKPLIFVRPNWFHSLVVASLSDLVIMAWERVFSRAVRARLCFWASQSRVARTVTLTTLAESKAVCARYTQVVLVERS